MNMKLWAITAFVISTQALFTDTALLCSVNPLSKIVVTSDKATCKKITKTKNEFLFTYHDNVKVLLADKTEITSQALEILIDASNIDKSKVAKASDADIKKELKSTSHFKQITFKGSVKLKNLNRNATADEMEIVLPTNICKLKGHVKISQNKVLPKDVPAIIESNLAVINLETEELTFTGTTNCPVCTTIDLEGCDVIQNNKKAKKHKKKSKQ